MKSKKDELLAQIDTVNNSEYQQKQLASNYNKFLKISKFNFDEQVIKKNVGDEARTFNIINQQKPLLSPSRILKVFQEHIFWNIPYKNMILPRLMGTLIHKFIEYRVKYGLVNKLDLENLEDHVGEEYNYIIKNWNEEKIAAFINEVNTGVSKIVSFLNLKNIQVLNVEKYVCDTEYHGFIDIVAVQRYMNKKEDRFSGMKKPMIIDLKVTTNKNMNNSYLGQLAIYRHLFRKTAQCYILFYDRDNQQCRLERAAWSELDETFKKINDLNMMFRK